MKKFLSLLLAALLLCSLCGVTALAEAPEELVGVFTLIDMIDPDSDEDAAAAIQAMAAIGLTATLTVNEDGSAVMDLFGEKNDLTFNFEEGIVTSAENPDQYISFSFDGDRLMLGEDESFFVFSKSGIETKLAGKGPFTYYSMISMIGEDGVDQFAEIKDFLDTLGPIELFVFREGDAILNMLGVQQSLKFDFEAMTVETPDGVSPFTLDDGVLCITDESGVALSFEKADPGFAGPYEMTIMINDEGDMSEQLALLGAMNLLPTLTIDEEGKGTMDLFGEKLEMFFDFDDMTVTVEGEESPFTYDMGVIQISEGEQSMGFARVLPAADGE